MSVSGVSSSMPLSQSVLAWQTNGQKIQSEFQQLGQDLQAGNITQAQSDFSVLSKNVSGSLQSNTSLGQAFSTLGTALQSGNASAAQQAYTALQQDVQQAGQDHRHHRGGNGSQNGSSSQMGPLSTLSQLFSNLGSALQSGSLTAAQGAYSTLTQDLSQLGMGGGMTAQSAAAALNFLG